MVYTYQHIYIHTACNYYIHTYQHLNVNVTQYFSLPHSLPIRPTRPASRVTRFGLPTSGAGEFIREEGSATYTQTRPITWQQRNIN